MATVHTRRRFLTGLSGAGAAALLRNPALAAEGPAETTSVRLLQQERLCIAPEYVVADLLRAEGFTDVRYVSLPPGANTPDEIAQHAIDFGVHFGSVQIVGIDRGVAMKVLAGVHVGCFELFVNNATRGVADLEGKKVGITSAGSASDLLAQWTMTDKKVNFTRVPLGGGGLVPNLLSGNVDAVVLYSPLTFKVMQDKTARSLIDFGAAVPEHLTGVWLASDKLIAEKPALIQKTANALFGAMASLRADRADAIKLISEIDEIPPAIAEAELDGNILKLSTTGEITQAWMEKSLDMAHLVGMTDLAPVGETFTTAFKPVPTR